MESVKAIQLDPLHKVAQTYSLEELLSCIDKGLNHFGPEVSRVIYWKLLTTFKIDRSQIVLRPADFVKALDDLFGLGSMAVKSAISRELQSKFGDEMAKYHPSMGVEKEEDPLARMITMVFHWLRENQV